MYVCMYVCMEMAYGYVDEAAGLGGFGTAS